MVCKGRGTSRAADDCGISRRLERLRVDFYRLAEKWIFLLWQGFQDQKRMPARAGVH